MTGLDWQTLSVSLAQGMDTKTDPKQVQSDFLLLQNSLFDEYMELTLRSGFAALTNSTYTGGSISVGKGLGELNDALLVYDGTSIYSRTTDLLTWATVGQKEAVTVTAEGIGSGSSPYIKSLNMAKAPNGLELYVWIDQYNSLYSGTSLLGLANYSVFDPQNNMIVTRGSIGNFASPRSCIRAEVVGTDFIIVLANGTTILAYKQPQATPNFSSASPTTVSASTETQFDTCVSSTSVYILADKVHRLITSSMTASSTAGSGYGSAPASSIAFDSVNSVVWALKETAATNTAVAFTVALVVIAGPTTISSAGFFTDVTLGPFGANCDSGFCYGIGKRQSDAFVAFKINLSGGATGTIVVVARTFLYTNGFVNSKPIVKDGLVQLIVAYMSWEAWNTTTPPALAINPIQPTSFWIKFAMAAGDTTLENIVSSRFLPLQTGLMYGVLKAAGPIYTQVFWSPANIRTVDNVNYFFPSLRTTATIASLIFANTLSPTATVVRSNFQFGNKIRSLNLASNAHSTGGFVGDYDSNIEVENNFLLFPEIKVSSSGSTGLPDGTYTYVAIYSWIDALGQKHRSSPSNAVTITITGGPKTVFVEALDNLMTDHGNNDYVLEIYRTASNGTIFFYVNSTTQGAIGSGGYGFFDSGNITTLELYTTGGEVENIAPPATSFMTTFKNRLMLIPSENPYQLWFSKQVIQGVPVEFSDLFVYNLDQRYGKATALASLDDKLIIFKEDGIFYMVGDGPAPSGANNDFSYPQNIPSDSGVTEPDSVVAYPEGVFYKGSKGIYVLTRGLQVQYIGAPVEAYNQYTVRASELDYETNIVKFTLSNGICLVYDYYVKKWSVFTNISAVASKISNGVYYYLQSNGIVQGETVGSYGDNGSIISMGLITGWLSFAKVQGFQRVRLVEILGEVHSPCTLTVSFAQDFDPTIVQTATITNTVAEDPWEWQVYPTKQKMSAMQVTLTVTPTVVGQGLSLSVISLEAGLKKGLNTLPANRSTSP